MTRASTIARLEQALSSLLAGQPTCTDGELTVSNLCAEAGVGRDSYYRSPALVEKFTTAKANADLRKPEIVVLREELAATRHLAKEKAGEAAAEHRLLEEKVKVYANQIQVLALRTAELAAENGQLRQRLHDQEGVVQLRQGLPAQ